MTHSQYTCKQVCDWIIEHRGEKDFIGWTIGQVVAEVFASVKANGFLYVADHSGIIGIIIAYPRMDLQVLCVEHLIATSPKAISMLVEEFYRRFTLEWRLAFSRPTKDWTILSRNNTHRLLRKFYGKGRTFSK